MKLTHRLPLLLCAILTLSACAGPPTTYLTLSAVAPSQTWPTTPQHPIAVSHPNIPPAIDRQHFIIQTGPSTLHVAGNTAWAAPLSGMIQLTLAQDLSTRLPNATVLMPGDPVPPGGAQQVLVNIQHFMPTPSGAVRLQADWSVQSPSGQSLYQGHIQFTQQGGPTPADAAHTMSLALATLSTRIAEQL